MEARVIGIGRAVRLGARPKTLLVSVMPILFTAVNIRPDFVLVVSALLAAVLIQVGTNLVNDVADFERGADTAERRGPTRVTQSGLCAPGEVWAAASLCFAASVVAAVPLLQVGGLPLLAVGLVSISAGFAYTAGPAPLAYKGLGEVFVFLFFGPVSVLTLCALFRVGGLTGGMTGGDVLASVQISLLAVAILGINNLRDISGDARAGKRTLAVRMGARAYRQLMSVVIFLPLALGAVWAWSGYLYFAILPALLFPLARRVIQTLWKDNDGPTWNRLLGQTAFLHMSFVAALCLGALLEL